MPTFLPPIPPAPQDTPRRTCLACGAAFLPRHPKQVCDTAACYGRWWRRTRKGLPGGDPLVPCAHCGVLSRRPTPAPYYCSPACAAAGGGPTCVVCGSPITGRRERFCSERCGMRARVRAHRGEPLADPPPSPCPVCKKPVVQGPSRSRVYCSMACRRRARRRRKRAEAPVANAIRRSDAYIARLLAREGPA